MKCPILCFKSMAVHLTRTLINSASKASKWASLGANSRKAVYLPLLSIRCLRNPAWLWTLYGERPNCGSLQQSWITFRTCKLQIQCYQYIRRKKRKETMVWQEKRVNHMSLKKRSHKSYIRLTNATENPIQHPNNKIRRSRANIILQKSQFSTKEIEHTNLIGLKTYWHA